MATCKHTRAGKAQSRSRPKLASVELSTAVTAYIEERRCRLYELGALLRATKQYAQGMNADVDTLLDLALGVVEQVNEELDSANLGHVPVAASRKEAQS